MSRGGYRPGAGRPKGQPANRRDAEAPTAPAKRPKASLPLAYMLAVKNDDQVDNARRDRMAIAAAPYVHGRAGDVGKKQLAAAAAQSAGAASEWGDDLDATIN